MLWHGSAIRAWQPIAVTHQAATVEAALDGAANTLERAIESTLERLRAV